VSPKSRTLNSPLCCTLLRAGGRKTQRAARIAALELSQRAAAAGTATTGGWHAAGANIVRDVARYLSICALFPKP